MIIIFPYKLVFIQGIYESLISGTDIYYCKDIIKGLFWKYLQRLRGIVIVEKYLSAINYVSDMRKRL